MGKYLDGIKKVQRAVSAQRGIIAAPAVKKELTIERAIGTKLAAVFAVAGNFKSWFSRDALAERANRRRQARLLKKEQKTRERLRRAEEKNNAEQERLKHIAENRREFIIKTQNTAKEGETALETEKQKTVKLRRAQSKLRAAKLELRLKAKENKKIIKQERRAARRKKREKMIKKWRNNFKAQRKKIAVGFILLVFILIILAGASSYVVYTRQPSENIVAVLANKLPFPAAIVNWRPIKYSDYLSESRLLGDYYAGASGADKKQVVLEKLIEHQILKTLAARYGLKLTDQEKEEAFKKFAAANGGLEKFTEKIYNEYGLIKELFIDRIVYYQALREKIKQAFVKDDRLHQSAVLRTDKVEKLLQKNKDDFETLAQKYSEDAHALQGGDIGYIKTSAMSEALKTAAQNLPVGEISPVIKEENKYYIVKAYDKKVNRKQEEEIWLKQITIFTNYDFDEYLADLRAKAKVWVLVSP